MMDCGLLTAPLLCAAGGAVLAIGAACIPALHAFSLIGILFFAQDGIATLPPECVIAGCFGVTVGYAAANSIPAVLLSAPDDSAMLTVPSGHRLLMLGRGYEAVLHTAAGGIGGLLFLLCLVAPLAPVILPTVITVMEPHRPWILGCIVCFMALSEWPTKESIIQTGRRGLIEAWKTPAAGLLTLTLSAFFGLAMIKLDPSASTADFRYTLAALAGMFVLPRLLVNVTCGIQLPEQIIPRKISISRTEWAHGLTSGAMGGSLAALMPMVSGGVGGVVSGHVAGEKNAHVVLIGQGAPKFIYYAGGLLLLFVPGAGMMRPIWLGHAPTPGASAYTYGIALTSLAVSGAVTFALLPVLTRACLRILRRYRRVTGAACLLGPVMVFAVSGPAGFGLMLVGLGIGLIPVLFHARQTNCLGFILIPAALGFTGL